MPKKAATYLDIEKYIRQKYHRTVKSCWIAHAKEIYGLPVSKSPRRQGKRMVPCPDSKLPWIKEAFKHFEMI